MQSHSMKFIIQKSAWIGVFAVVAFAISRIIPVIMGSQLHIDQLANTSEGSNPVIAISGSASDTKSLTINGAPIALSPAGTFSQTLLLHPGYNTITFDTSDKLGRAKKESFAFLLKELDSGTFAVSAFPSQN